MPRRVFFSFQYDRDVQRASVVRNSWVVKPNAEEAGFIDAAKWEEVRKQGDDATRSWINDQLNGTSVTAVLIGPETSSRDWVRYELQRSFARGNGILGIYIHNIKDFEGKTDTKGDTYFGELGKDSSGNSVFFSSYPTYDWVANDGYSNFGMWVETAAKKAGR